MRFSPVGRVEAGRRLAQIAQLDAVLRRERAQLGVVGDELVEAVLDVEPACDAFLQELAPGRRETAAGRRDADERGRRAEPQGVGDGADDREAFEGLPRPLRVEDPDDLLGPVAEHAAGGLPVVRIGGVALREDEEPTFGQPRALEFPRVAGRRP